MLKTRRSDVYDIEVTDTFAGEANYCWVKRGRTRAKSRRGVVRAVKALAGWDGWCRVRVEDLGDMFVVRPTATSGVPQVAFATWAD
jgi:hypothetical protein